jgi:hypothetical protein
MGQQGSTRMIKKIMFIMGGQVSTQMIKKKSCFFNHLSTNLITHDKHDFLII